MIACIDLDCFYVSCEIAKAPHLSGKPVLVVGGEGDKGVVLSASYEARKYGIKSGMPLFKARELCPFTIFLKPDFKYYEEVSKKIRNLIFSYTPLVEQGSIDEFYLSFKGCERLYKNAFFDAIKNLRKQIKEEFKIPSSAGLSSTKCTSKILSKVAKPEKQIFVLKEKEFLANLPINLIPGLGKKKSEKLKNIGFEKIEDLQRCPKGILLAILGKNAKEIQMKALGIYEEPFILNHIPKSIGKERTFFEGKIEIDEILDCLFWLTEEVVFKMRVLSLFAKKIEVKLKYSDFKVESRSFTFLHPLNSYNIFQKKAKEILFSIYKRRTRVRLIGFSVSDFENLSGQRTLDIFNEERENSLLKVVDFLKKKYGLRFISFGRNF